MNKFIMVAISVLPFVSQAARADIRVRAYSASGSEITTMAQNGIASGAAITIAINLATSRIFIFDGDSTTPDMSVGKVTINGTTSSGTLFVTVGNPSSVTIPPTPDSFLDPLNPNRTYAVDFGGLTVSQATQRSTTVFSAQISRNVTGDIDVGKIRRLIAGGNISATLRGRDDNAGGGPGNNNDYSIGLIRAASITSTGEIRTTSSSFAGIYAIDVGSLFGPIDAAGGRIVRISVTNQIGVMTS